VPPARRSTGADRRTVATSSGTPLNPILRLRTAPVVGLRRVLVALALVSQCAATPARPAAMIPGSPIRPKDFSLVKKDGYYHIFYILNSASLQPGQTETSFGHAISSDLYHWTQLDPVLQVDSTLWDNTHVWAPSIVFRDSLYYMFYAGVTTSSAYDGTQRIGLAVSSDLMTWNRMDAPVYAGTQVPWAWADSTNSLPAFRDPFVMPDPANPGSWLMYFMSSYGPDTAATVVGVARSSGDFTSWQDAGPLLITWRNYSFNQSTESPHVFRHGGLWYLFVTTGSSQPLSFYTSPDPVGPLGDWIYRGRLRNMLDVDTSPWFASEYLRDGIDDLFAYVNGDRIEVRQIQWGSGWTFALLQPPFFHVVDLDWTKPVATAGDTLGLFVQSANSYAGPPQLVYGVVDSLGNETPVPSDSIGLPAAPELPADTTTIWFTARRWPAVSDSDTVTVTRLHVHTADSTAFSAMLTIRAKPLPPFQYGEDTTSATIPGPPLEDPIQRLIKKLFFRALGGTPISDGPAVAIGLPDPWPVSVDLYDVTGRRVRNLAMRTLPAGVSVLPWDGRDASGAPVGRGIYFARLRVGGLTRTLHLLLLRR